MLSIGVSLPAITQIAVPWLSAPAESSTRVW